MDVVLEALVVASFTKSVGETVALLARIVGVGPLQATEEEGEACRKTGVKSSALISAGRTTNQVTGRVRPLPQPPRFTRLLLVNASLVLCCSTWYPRLTR
jgi:hypothetical protein